jgi:predicted nucleic acid-binding protein
MADDIVIDTNVLLHASDTRQEFHGDCLQFLTFMIECETKICLDNGWHPVEAKNRSKIMSEYLRFVQHGTVAHALMALLAQSMRIKVITTRVDQRSSKAINAYVRDPTDRCFVKVALNSQGRLLVSHDFAAMNAHCRKMLRDSISVDVVDVIDANRRIAPTDTNNIEDQS